MTGITTPFLTIRIEAPHSTVRPRIGIQNWFSFFSCSQYIPLKISLELQHTSMTLPATINGICNITRQTSHLFSQNVIQTCQYFPCTCMMTSGKLFILLWMATGTVLWGNESRYPGSYVLPGVNLSRIGFVAIHTTNSMLGMP